MQFKCDNCGCSTDKPTGAVNRARRAGLNLYCGKLCAGLARRTGLSKAEKVANKAAYDAERRAERADQIRAEKAEYHKRTYDPAKAAVVRKERMPYHVEYCRRPEYREKKAEYDRQHRADEYGVFADAFLMLQEVDKELRSQASGYERRVQRGYYTRSAQQRRRDLWLSKQPTP